MPSNPSGTVRPAPSGEADQAPGSLNRKAAQILSAAAELFLQRGFEAITMDEVARTSGVSKATLYVYFASKEDLFAAVMREETRRMNDQIWTPRDGDHDVEVVLRRVARNFAAVFLAERTIACKRALLGALPRFPDVGGVIYESGPAKMAATIADFLRKAHDGGQVDAPDPEFAARQFISLIRGDFELGGVLALPPPSKAEIDHVIEGALEMFLARYRKR